MFNTRQALLKTIPCLSHGNTYLNHSHVLHMGIFVLLSQHLHDPSFHLWIIIYDLPNRLFARCTVLLDTLSPISSNLARNSVVDISSSDAPKYRQLNSDAPILVLVVLIYLIRYQKFCISLLAAGLISRHRLVFDTKISSSFKRLCISFNFILR